VTVLRKHEKTPATIDREPISAVRVRIALPPRPLQLSAARPVELASAGASRLARAHKRGKIACEREERGERAKEENVEMCGKV